MLKKQLSMGVILVQVTLLGTQLLRRAFGLSTGSMNAPAGTASPFAGRPWMRNPLNVALLPLTA